MKHPVSEVSGILNSSGGIHLSIYIEGKLGIVESKKMLQKYLVEAEVYLSPVLSESEKQKFLDPIYNLLLSDTFLNGSEESYAIFRKNNELSYLKLPLKVAAGCHVATTFHVKPILSWKQVERKFYLIHSDHEKITLYFANKTTCQKISAYEFEKNDENKTFQERNALATNKNATFSNQMKILAKQIDFSISKHSTENTNTLFFSGISQINKEIFSNLKYPKKVHSTFLSGSSRKSISKNCEFIRNYLAKEALKAHESSVEDFRFALLQNRVMKNIFQIAKCAVLGKIQRLIISEDQNLFGKLNEKNGDIKLYPRDKDHEDDDILDDIAQIVLKNGGEVIVTPSQKIPNYFPILAISDSVLQDQIAHIFSEDNKPDTIFLPKKERTSQVSLN